MTIAELIEQLRTMPDWWPVQVYGDGGEMAELDDVTREGNHARLQAGIAMTVDDD